MPLFFHLHDRDQSVAQVGISKPLACAAPGALRRAPSPPLPAAAELAAAEEVGRDVSYPCPARSSGAEQQCAATKTEALEPPWASQGRLQVSEARPWTPNPCHPPALPRDPLAVLSPGRKGHLPLSAALQASREALLGAAKLLKRRQLRKLLETEQPWRLGECLVRAASKPHSQTGEAPLPPRVGAPSWAPARCGVLGARAGEGREGQPWAQGEALGPPCPLLLSPAGGKQPRRGGLPAAEPAVPAEPTGALARGGRQIHR